MLVKKMSKHLPCTLSESEKLQKFKELGEMFKKKKILDTDLLETAERVKELKKSVGGMDQEIKELGHIAETGVEWRTVECEKTIDEVLQKKIVVRLDTGEVVEDRKLTDDELQVEIEFE